MKHLINYTEPPSDKEFHQRSREELEILSDKITAAGTAARKNEVLRGAWERSRRGIDAALAADSNTAIFVAERDGEYFFASAPAGKSLGASGGSKPMNTSTKAGHE